MLLDVRFSSLDHGFYLACPSHRIGNCTFRHGKCVLSRNEILAYQRKENVNVFHKKDFEHDVS